MTHEETVVSGARDPRVWVILATVGLFALGSARPARADHDDEKYLYIWAGHVDHSIPDFLAVIDFDEDSPGYGEVINVVPLPVRGATFNEPHHMHLSVNKRIPGMRRAPERPERPARDVLLRHDQPEKATVPVLRGRPELEHHRRLLSTPQGRVPGDADGLGRRRRAPGGSSSSTASCAGSAHGRSDRRPTGSIRTGSRSARPEPDADQRLHPPGLDAGRRPRAAGPSEHSPGVGLPRSAGSSRPSRCPAGWG